MPHNFNSGGTDVTLNALQITSINGLPPGLSWTCNESDNTYDITSDVLTQRGCVKICGSPTSFGLFQITVNVLAYANALGFDVQQPETFTIPLNVLAGAGGNSGFAFEPASGCDSITVNFEALITSSTNPVQYTWDFGNGQSSTEQIPAAQLYDSAGIFTVNLTTELLGFKLTQVNFTATGENWCGDTEEPSLFGNCIGSPDIYYIFTMGNASQTSSSGSDNANFSQAADILLTENVFSLNFWDEDVISQDDNLGTSLITVNGPGNYSFNTNEGFGQVTIEQVVLQSYTHSDTVEVYESPEVPVLTVGDSVLCFGDSTTLSIAGYFSQQWFADSVLVAFANDTVFPVNSAGTYYVEVRNASGCSAVSAPYTASIIPLPPTPSIFPDPITGELVSNPGASYTWVWLYNGNPIEGSENATRITPEQIGDYQVFVTTPEGCSRLSTAFPFDNTGVQSLLARTFKVYPQPLHEGPLYIEAPVLGNQTWMVELCDLSGRPLIAKPLKAQAGRLLLETEALASGLYMLQLRSETGNLQSLRVLVD